MTSRIQPSKRAGVVIAAAVVLVLAGTLAARVVVSKRSRGSAPQAPAARVPAPPQLDLNALELPWWSFPQSAEGPVRFRIDLDLLAPLGDGPANAAEYFKGFNRPDGPRFDEAEAAMAARVEGPEWLGRVLPADHPLLEEAAPWCDQATMRFYPGVFDFAGSRTRIPNLDFMRVLAKSWVVRGLASEDPAAAAADFRRAIRLGRLLRQDDLVLLNDLIGLECIHVGARGMYELAVSKGDLELAVLAAFVIGEVAPQHLVTAQRVSSAVLGRAARVRIDEAGAFYLVVDDRGLQEVIDMAADSPDRRFRAEALVVLGFVRHHAGTPEQRQRLLEVLDRLAASQDPLTAEIVRWWRDTPFDSEELARFFGP